MNKKQNIKKGLTVLLIILANTAFANTDSIIAEQQKHAAEIIKNFDGKFNGFKKSFGYKTNETNETKKYQRYIDKLGANTKKISFPQFIRPAPRAIIFVSFSMPDLLLQQIIKQASFYQIPVVIRGLYQNSFRATVNEIFKLVKQNNEGGVLIDPIWFHRFDIKAVPALIVQNNKKFDVIYGNIPIKRALEIIKERGEEASLAKQILEDNEHA